jgi:hypothetical protein
LKRAGGFAVVADSACSIVICYVGIGRHDGGYVMHTNTVPRNWIVHCTGWRAKQVLGRPIRRYSSAFVENREIEKLRREPREKTDERG